MRGNQKIENSNSANLRMSLSSTNSKTAHKRSSLNSASKIVPSSFQGIPIKIEKEYPLPSGMVGNWGATWQYKGKELVIYLQKEFADRLEEKGDKKCKDYLEEVLQHEKEEAEYTLELADGDYKRAEEEENLGGEAHFVIEERWEKRHQKSWYDYMEENDAYIGFEE